MTSRGTGRGKQGETDHDGPLVRLALWWRSGRLASIGPFARDAFVSLACHESMERGAFPSADTIAEETGRTPKLVYRELKRLVKLGMIERLERTRKPKVNAPGSVPSSWAYRILPCPPSPVDIHQTGISKQSGYPSPVPSISMSDATGYPFPIPQDIHPRGRGRVFEGLREGLKEGVPISLALLGEGPTNGDGHDPIPAGKEGRPRRLMALLNVSDDHLPNALHVVQDMLRPSEDDINAALDGLGSRFRVHQRALVELHPEASA